MSTRNIIQALQGAAGAAAGGGVLDVDDVFSIDLIFGNGSTQQITNGLDLSSEKGLVWSKERSTSIYNHALVDNVSNKFVMSDNTSAAADASTEISSFNTDGFTLHGTGDYNNVNNRTYVSFSFRQAPRFFQCLTYSGTGSAQTISHSLGSTPAMIFVKNLSNAQSWYVFHTSVGATKGLILDGTYAAILGSSYWNDTAPTSTQFTVGANASDNGDSYVAYLFAHNNSDGGFGPDSDQDIIKCGSYTGAGSGSSTTVNLGFEPQFVLLKNTSSTSAWSIVDNMRGLVTGGNDQTIEANTTGAEYAADLIDLTSTGFVTKSNFSSSNTSGDTFIYMAIRRGPLAEPTAVDDVFEVDTVQASSGNQPAFKFDFVTDFIISRQVTATQDWLTNARLLGQNQLKLNTTDGQSTNSAYNWDYMDGAWDPFSASPVFSAWGWKRAPKFFDIVVTKAVSTNNGNVNHNLGVKPEMAWYKRVDGTDAWYVASALNGYLSTNNSNAAAGTASGSWLDDVGGSIGGDDATATTINSGYKFVGNATYDMIILLFSSLAGISKVGSYVGNGSSQTIDCGFSNGARLVLVKQSSSTGSWLLFDYGRGIASGNDSLLQLNATGGEYTGADYIDPDSSGFIAKGDLNNMNTNGQTFLFYAIAA